MNQAYHEVVNHLYEQTRQAEVQHAQALSLNLPAHKGWVPFDWGKRDQIYQTPGVVDSRLAVLGAEFDLLRALEQWTASIREKLNQEDYLVNEQHLDTQAKIAVRVMAEGSFTQEAK